MAGRTKDLVSIDTESSMAKVAANQVSKLVTLALPWIVGVFAFGLAVALHYILFSPDTLAARGARRTPPCRRSWPACGRWP
jgi:hypothetical protein